MAQLTKAQLATENQNDFPNNNTGQITPAILRGFNTDMIDSLVDEVSYNIDSASFSGSITQLQNFSSSLDATFATDAQLTSLSASIAVTDLSQSSSIAALQVFSSSLDATFATDAQLSASASTLQNNINTKLDSASFNSYTQSNDSKVNALINATGSYVTEAESGSFVTSVLAGGTPNVISVTKGNGTINTITVNNVTSASYAISSSRSQEVIVIARNGNASTLPTGTIVRITSAVGDNPIFNTASFTDESTSANTLGVLQNSIASGADGDVVVIGKVVGVDTNPANGYVAGDIIYLSSSGQFTRVKPQAPQQTVVIGEVLRAQQNNGSIFVNISNGWELNELHNVAINNVADGDLLVYRSGSGLWTNSSSLELGNATTGSNTFGGTQTMNNLVVNGTASFAYTQTVTGSAVIIGEEYIILNNQTPTAPYAGLKIYDSGSTGVTASLLWDGVNDHWVYEQVSGAAYGAAGFLSGPTGSSLSSIIYPTANRLVKGGGSDHLYDSNISDNGSVVSSAVNVEVTGSVTATGGFIGNASTATTASFATTALSASFVQSSSFAENAGLLDGKDSTEFATTGSNSFKGVQYVSASLYVRNGDIFNISDNTTLNPDLYLTESLAGQVNIIKGWGDTVAAAGPGLVQSNYTGSIRITGSNNTISLPQIAATALGGTSDLLGYISGSDNQILSNNAGILLNTGSLVYPKTQNNTLTNGSTIRMSFTNSGSLAAGNPLILSNFLLAGNIVANSNSGSIQAITTNIINGGGLTSTQNFATNTKPSLSNNNINGGTVTLNHISSSITFNSNNVNGTITVNNHLSSSGLSTNGLSVTNNMVFGGTGGSPLNIYVSGSQSSNTSRVITDSIIGGRNIIISSSFISSSNASLVSSVIVGNGLVVSASHSANGGTAFLGRFNDTGSLSSTQDIIFAVGTGTSLTSRRTGLWIDSGSNTNISGTLEVIGNTAFTGSVDVSGSTTTLQNLGGIALAVRSGSVEVTSPQGTGYFYTNLPLTSSAARINGTALVSDLIVSGVFSGNSSLQVLGNSSFTGSVFTSASVNGVVNPLTISSNTASLDFSKGNFFTIQLVSGSSTHINPTNVIGGQTVNIRVNTTGSGTVTFPSTIKQASGSLYTPTTSTGVDVLTMVTFDASNVYLANVKNLV